MNGGLRTNQHHQNSERSELNDQEKSGLPSVSLSFITEAYIESEIRAISHEYDVLVIAIDRDPVGTTHYDRHSDYRCIYDDDEIEEEIKKFGANIVHAHRLFMLPRLARICHKLGLPYTVRSHAHDAIPSRDPRVASWMNEAPQVLSRLTSCSLCRGVLAFPFARRNLENWGVKSNKIFDCYPVIDFKRFHNTTLNGTAVVNSASYMPKKNMEDFLRLGEMMSTKNFKLYALSSRMHSIEKLKSINRRMNNPVTIMDPVQPENMPREWKQAEWMVYTADRDLANVGWPVSIAEAQAAGVGVCVPNIRPDISDYVGKGGYIYSSLEEVVKIISSPFNQERRELGFEQARKSDVFQHREILLSLWNN